MPPTVFISYSHEDEVWKNRLLKHLAVLKQQGKVEVWDDRKIRGGDEWPAEIWKAMDAAQVAVLLVSANSLASEFILEKEVPYLLERRKKDGIFIFPILCSDCLWRHFPWLSDLQMFPRDGKALAAFRGNPLQTELKKVAQEILETLCGRSDFTSIHNSFGFEFQSVPKASVQPTFEDIPTTYWAWPYVKALVESGLIHGFKDGLYCPTLPVTRAEMAVFIVRALHGTSFTPLNVSATRFADIPSGYWAAAWIEQFAIDGITSGYGSAPRIFCPESETPRDQMAVFLLRALHGADYIPPPPTGTRFKDVPANYWAAAWIEQLAAEGITGGCATDLYCPGAPVSREQMAVFLTRAFNLPFP